MKLRGAIARKRLLSDQSLVTFEWQNFNFIWLLNSFGRTGWNLVFSPLHQTLRQMLTSLHYAGANCLLAFLGPLLRAIKAVLRNVEPKRWWCHVLTWTRCGTIRLNPLTALATAQSLKRSYIPESLRTFLNFIVHGRRPKGVVLGGAWLVPICCGEATELWFTFEYRFMQARCICSPLKFWNQECSVWVELLNVLVGCRSGWLYDLVDCKTKG